jgi:TonB family protein
MSKPRLIASLAIALAVLVATGWWAVRTFWLTAPLGPPEQGLVYESASAPGSNVPSSLMFYKAGGDVTAPVPIYQPEPPYTPLAKKDKVQGVVRLAVGVDASGNVAGVELLRGVGEELDERAIETLRTWKSTPAMKKGKPVPVRVVVETNFRLF